MKLPRADQFINIHTHQDQAGEDEFALKNLDPGDFYPEIDDAQFSYSIGLHPWQVSGTDRETEIKKVEMAAGSGKIAAIGEIGIDRAIDTPVIIQEEAFLEQVKIADRHNLPVVVHSVRSYSDLLGLKDSSGSRVPWIIHGFYGGFETSAQLVRKGFFLSFSHRLAAGDPRLARVFRTVPVDRIFLETDESAYRIAEIYASAASVRNMGMEELKRQICTNFFQCFGA